MLGFLIAQVFQVHHGDVAYWTRVLSAGGLVPHTVQAVNREVSGEVILHDSLVQGTLYVPVVRFSSGNLQRDQDVAELLGYQTHPFIVVRFTQHLPDALLERLESETTIQVPFTFFLTVKDCTQAFPGTPVQITRHGDTLVAHTEIFTRFTALGLSPPRLKGLGFLGGFVSRAADTLVLRGTLFFLEEHP
jgi:hypothetical protein